MSQGKEKNFQTKNAQHSRKNGAQNSVGGRRGIGNSRQRRSQVRKNGEADIVKCRQTLHEIKEVVLRMALPHCGGFVQAPLTSPGGNLQQWQHHDRRPTRDIHPEPREEYLSILVHTISHGAEATAWPHSCRLGAQPDRNKRFYFIFIW